MKRRRGAIHVEYSLHGERYVQTETFTMENVDSDYPLRTMLHCAITELILL